MPDGTASPGNLRLTGPRPSLSLANTFAVMGSPCLKTLMSNVCFILLFAIVVQEGAGGRGNEHLRDGEGAGAYRTVTGESGDVTSAVPWRSSPEEATRPRLPYDLQLEKDAVYQVRLAVLLPGLCWGWVV